jgi:hypothetical protein
MSKRDRTFRDAAGDKIECGPCSGKSRYYYVAARNRDNEAGSLILTPRKARALARKLLKWADSKK